MQLTLTKKRVAIWSVYKAVATYMGMRMIRDLKQQLEFYKSDSSYYREHWQRISQAKRLLERENDELKREMALMEHEADRPDPVDAGLEILYEDGDIPVAPPVRTDHGGKFW